MTTIKFLSVLLASIILKTVCSQEIMKSTNDLQKTGTETLTFASKVNSKTYKLYINLPNSYAIDTTKTYPVFYKLDGQWSFTSVVSSYYAQQYDGYVPEIIIVGISYGGENPNYDSLRATDFTPTVNPYIANSGGAALFQQVLADEIIPIIDSTYRTDKVNRALAGTSFGGLFTHYCLFTKPELFNAYLITNPSFWWDGDYVYTLEKQFAQNHKNINARVLYSSGEFDAVNNVVKMFNQINNHKYNGLSIDFKILEGMGHAGSKAESHAKGLSYIYKRPHLKLPNKKLQEYTGTYSFSWFGNVIIEIEDGHLAINEVLGNPNLKIYPVNDNEFTYNGTYKKFYFTRDSSGKVNGYILEINEHEIYKGDKID